MSEVTHTKNISSKNEYKRKLKVNEYVLEIDNKDIYDINVTYKTDEIESIIYKDGKRFEEKSEPVLVIELNGKDKDDNEAWISFDLKVDINYLNTLPKEPTDITNLLVGSESFIKKPNNELPGFLDFNIPTNTLDDIYKNLSSLWISKINTNEFLMKLCVPNEVFTYFKIIFDNE